MQKVNTSEMKILFRFTVSEALWSYAELRVLMMVCNTEDRRLYELYPSSRVRND
jgi:hypothetical protein